MVIHIDLATQMNTIGNQNNIDKLDLNQYNYIFKEKYER